MLETHLSLCALPKVSDVQWKAWNETQLELRCRCSQNIVLSVRKIQSLIDILKMNAKPPRYRNNTIINHCCYVLIKFPWFQCTSEFSTLPISESPISGINVYKISKLGSTITLLSFHNSCTQSFIFLYSPNSFAASLVQTFILAHLDREKSILNWSPVHDPLFILVQWLPIITIIRSHSLVLLCLIW